MKLRPVIFLALLLIGITRIDWFREISPANFDETLPHPIPLYVVDYGVHANLVIPYEAFAFAPPALGELIRRKGPAAFIEIGWGDRGFYMEAGDWGGLNAPIIARALFIPSPGVMQIVPLGASPEAFLPANRFVRLSLTPGQLRTLLAELAEAMASFEPIGPSLYGHGHFYPARERYHIFFTCNNWVAARLRKIGLLASPLLASFSRPLLWEIRWRNL